MYMDKTLLAPTSSPEFASLVTVNGEPFTPTYVRMPDEATREDDIVLEAEGAEGEVSFTRGELDDAEAVAPGYYRLKSGIMVGFLSPVTIH